MTTKQAKLFKLARENVNVLTDVRNAFTLGWCTAFVQFGRVYVIQRAS